MFKFKPIKAGVFAVFTFLSFYSFSNPDLLPTNVVDPHSKFESAEVCGNCHTTQYNQWRSSMMGYSSISPPIHALELTENHVDRGPRGFGRLTRSENEPKGIRHNENALFCQKCHAPIAVFTDLFANAQVFNFDEQNRGDFPDSHLLLRQIAGLDPATDLDPTDPITPLERSNAFTAMEGVTCSVCHSIDGIETNNIAPFRQGFDNGIANSAYRINHYDESVAFEDKDMVGPISPLLLNNLGHGKKQSGQFILGNDGFSRPFIKSGEFCATCHDVRIPATDAITGEPFRRVENLFTEWQNSPWNNNNQFLGDSLENPGDIQLNGVKEVTSCQDCHMSTFMTDLEAKPGEYFQGQVSDLSSGNAAGGISNHRFVGVDRFLVHAQLYDENQNPKNETLANYDISEIAPADLSSRYSDFDVSSLDFSSGKADAREILLKKAIDFSIVSVVPSNNELEIKISAENVGAGHNIPAGLSQERQVWIELEVVDGKGQNVYTSGYLTPLEEDPSEYFDPYGTERYKDSFCGETISGVKGKHEYECDLDSFRVEDGSGNKGALDDAFRLESGSVFVDGDDADLRKKTGAAKKNLGLINYQNGFTTNGDKVLTQFIADAIDNGNSLEPFKPQIHQYDIDTTGHEGPFVVNARLRFRPLPHEFLAVLERLGSARVTKDVIERNKVIEMTQDSCAVGNASSQLDGQFVPACNATQAEYQPGRFMGCRINPSDSGTVSCWGQNSHGQLGNGTTNDTVTPIQVKNLSGVTQLVTGVATACALTEDQTVSCWGDGEWGRVGDGIITEHDVLEPRQISPALLNNVTAITSRGHTFCAIVEDAQLVNTVSCWGSGIFGNLGDGDTTVHFSGVPKQIDTNVLSDVKQLSNSCALLNDGRVKCWGYNSQGSLGIGNVTGHVGTPTEVVGLPYKAKAIDGQCAQLVNDDLYCWGSNSRGVLGVNNPSVTVSLTAVKADLPGKVEAFTTSTARCALLDDKKVYCWGSGIFGELGDGITAFDLNSEQHVPTQVVGINTDIVSLVGDTHKVCATDVNDDTYCWGYNFHGELGLGHKNFVGSATLVDHSTIFNENAEDNVLDLNLTNTGTVGWRQDTNGTTSFNTGPSSGANGSSGYYYFETSSGFGFPAGETAILETDFFDAQWLSDKGAEMNFNYHMYGSDIGHLYIDVFINGSWNTNFWSRNFDQGNTWHSTSFDMGQFSGLGKVKFRLRAVSAGGFRGDTAVDNVRVVTTQ